MQDKRSIASKAASIAVNSNESGKRISNSSSLRTAESPFFDKNCRKVLVNIDNFKMENNKKVPFKISIPMRGMVSSKEISRSDGKTREDKAAASGAKFKKLDDDFLQNLLKNKDANSIKNPGLSALSLMKCKPKKKTYVLDETSRKLMDNFKKEFRENNGAASPLLLTANKKIFSKNSTSSIDSSSSAVSVKAFIRKQTEISCKDNENNELPLSEINKYSAPGTSNYSDDLFDFRGVLQAESRRSDHPNSFGGHLQKSLNNCETPQIHKLREYFE